MNRLTQTLRRAVRGGGLATVLVGLAVLLPTLPAQAQADWTDWSDLVGGFATSRPAVERNADGRLEVFVRGGDNALWHISQVRRNGIWSGWASLGGYLTSNAAVERNADGRLEVFVRGGDGRLYHRLQK